MNPDALKISSACKKCAVGACPPERRKREAFIGSKVFKYVPVFGPEGQKKAPMTYLVAPHCYSLGAA